MSFTKGVWWGVSSRPLDKGGGGEGGGGRGGHKMFFFGLLVLVWPKIRGAGPLPGSTTVNFQHAFVKSSSNKQQQY